MADKKITQLNPLAVAASGSIFPIVDISGTPGTKRITFGQMMASPGSIGSITPSTAEFTDLTLSAGATISEFTIDPTLAGNSDSNVPTEKAVKAYVESKLHGVIFDATDSKSIVYIDTTGGLTVDKVNFYWNDVLKSLNVKGNASFGDDAYPTESLGKTFGLTINKVLTDPSIGFYTGINNNILSDSTADIIGLTTSISKNLSSGSITGNYTTVVNSSYTNTGNITGSKLEVFDYNGTPNEIIGQDINIIANPSYIASGLTALKVTGFIGASTIAQDVVGINVDMSTGGALPLSVISGDTYGIKLTSISPQCVVGTSYGLYVAVDSTSGVPDYSTSSVPDYSIYVEGLTSKVKFEGSLESISVDTTSLNAFTLKLQSGATINEISTDGTLSGDSDLAVPTEKAVKAYVDSIQVSTDRIFKGLTSAQAFDNIDSTGFSGIVFKTRDLMLGDATGSITTIFYFNGYSTSNWTNPQNMVDPPSLLTYAQAGTASGTYTQINNSNTIADSTGTIGSIIKVELGLYYQPGSGGNIQEALLYPLFGGSNEGTPLNFSGGVGNWLYYDITHDTQAPLDWTWQDLINLGSKVKVRIGAPGGSPTDYERVRLVGIRVTYANQGLITGSKEVANFDKAGLILEYGVRINKFSSDGTLVGNSDSAIPTERAVKTYINNIIQHLDLMRVRTVTQDSTAVSGEAILVDGTGDIVIHIVPKNDGRYVIKNLTSHKITMIPTFGSIDYESLYINHTLLKSITMISNGANIFIV
jgi:hypothetical protein